MMPPAMQPLLSMIAHALKIDDLQMAYGIADASTFVRDNGDMDILLNGEPRRLEPRATIAGLLDAEGLAERRVAVEVNGEIVPRGRHASHALNDGDKIEIVHALGGG